MPASRALSALAARARLGRGHLHVLVHPEPQHRARRLGHAPAQGRAHDGVRDPRRAPAAGARPRAAGARRRGRVRGHRRAAPALRPGPARGLPRPPHRRRRRSPRDLVLRRLVAASPGDRPSDMATPDIPCKRRCGKEDTAQHDRSRDSPRDMADEGGGDRAGRRARGHPAALARLARGRGAALPLDRAARPRGAARGPRRGGRRSSTAGRKPASATGGRRSARFAEDRAPVYLRPSAEVSAPLRALGEQQCRLGVFTDAPDALARIAVAQLGASSPGRSARGGSGRARAPP